MTDNRSTTTGAVRRSALRPRLLALLALTLAATPALTLLGPAEALDPAAVGPGDPGQHGFPAYYTDDDGIALQMCDDGTAACARATDRALTPPDGENFYFVATADMTSPGLSVSIEFAAEAAWATRTAPVTFDRLRIRGHADAAGSYTVTHPYGTTTVTAGDPVEQRNINFTEDVGCTGANCNFTRMASAGTAHITSWIISDTAPPGYLGNGVRAATATMGGASASVSVTGPAGTASTDRFVVMGKRANPHAVSAPKTVKFGVVRNVKTRTVRVKNLGTVPLTIHGTKLTGSPAFRRTRSTCTAGRVLGIGGTCTVGVRFRSPAFRLSKAALRINDDTPSGGRTVHLIGR